MTASFGSLERSLIKLSVMPSLRYSVSGLPLWLVKGSTATDETSSVAPRDFQPNQPAAPRISTAVAPAAHFHGTLGATPDTCAEGATSTFAELESRRSRFRSLSKSAAFW